ncbi:MAG TPA: hypothetical protein VKE74_14080, partial [Gemmataceae bacterium]|nr:hypothetical protein [Gemmataceae bacterium]
MTDRRTPPRLVRRAALAAAAACALGGVAVAGQPPSRDYPPTYTSRKAPWYDPFGWFTSDPKPKAPVPKVESRPIPNEMVDLPPGAATNPAWRWYGYGTPTPGRNPLAPYGTYAGVPGNWYGATGTTPGAIPAGRLGPPPSPLPEIFPAPGVVADPAPRKTLPAQLIPPAENPGIAVGPPTDPVAEGPKLPGVATPPTTAPAGDGEWRTAPASLRPPTTTGAALPGTDSAPPAKLRAPIRDDEPPTVPVATPTRPTPPDGAALPNENSESPDIPVEPAPGIIPPPVKGGVSMADRPITARGHAPEPDVADMVRRACGPGARIVDVTRTGPKGLIVR